MKRGGILVAGVGNVFFRDDGFGPTVARRLSARPIASRVHVVDFGTRGLHLAYELLEGYDAAILVDTTRRGGQPGTLYVLAPETTAGVATADAHDLDPAKMLAFVRTLGGELPTLRIVACEAGTLGGDDDLSMELSEPVAAAIEPAIALVEDLLRELGEVAHA
jgi:hydrogenase maturation protease